MRKNLTAELILTKKFNQEINGYSPAQVDAFLDMVKEDYMVFTEETDQQKNKLKEAALNAKTQFDIIEKNKITINRLKREIRLSLKK